MPSEIPLREYKRVRSNPRRFLVAPTGDHVFPAVERVVESNVSYVVVEKIETAARIAEETASPPNGG